MNEENTMDCVSVNVRYKCRNCGKEFVHSMRFSILMLSAINPSIELFNTSDRQRLMCEECCENLDIAEVSFRKEA